MYDIITIGDIKLDTFVLLPEASVHCQLKMPECHLCIDYGKKIPVEVVDSQMAGSAPNVAVGLSRMQKKTAIISMMGEDGTRRLALEVLKKESVDTKYIKSIRGVQSSYSVVLNYRGEKTILAAHVPNVYRLPTPFPKTKWIYVGELGEGYEKMYEEVTHEVSKNGTVLGFNPGAIQIKEGKRELFDLIKHTYVLFVNLEEAQEILKTKSREIHQLVTKLHQLGPRLLVITNGREGAYVYNGEELYYAPMFPGERVEATGAGDGFATGYIGALMNGQTHDEALRWGAINAASVVLHVGPQKGLLSAGQIRYRLNRNKAYKTELM